MTVEVVTFGCRLNLYESELMKRRATEAGLADAVIVNTCAVTGEAVRQARQAIRRARREHPQRRIVVTGCAAQIEPQEFAAIPEVDAVIGNEEKLTSRAYRDLPEAGTDASKPLRVGNIMTAREFAPQTLVDGFGTPRAFVRVQAGCDHRCTFCIIPFARGMSRSLPVDAVVRQVGRLVENGYREVVLTGVDLTSWGQGLPGEPRLGSLVRAILRSTDVERLRLSSIDCAEADAELLRCLAEEDRLMPHVHLSLQSGDDLVLKRMKRRHLRADAVAFCDEIRRMRPDVALGADLIAGFPTETDSMFESTLRLVDECDLVYLHVFPFSPRTGTPAALMPQVARAVARERAARLREAGAAALARRMKAELGRRRRALVERAGLGRTEHFAPVTLECGEPGQVLPVLIAGTDARGLVGKACKEAA